jgi:KUP system potassium uptake protein
LILRSPKAVANPFFLLLPSWAQVPMVLLATVATVIASQSVISGAFSVTRQAVQLGFLPRAKFRETSAHEIGQIYAPAINRGLFVAVVVLVVGFGSSAALASAYGVAVTGTFILNTILFLAVARLLWHRPKRLIALGAIVFLSIEVTFFAANLTKIFHGGWLPLVIASAVFVVSHDMAQGAPDRDRQPQPRGGAPGRLHQAPRRARFSRRAGTRHRGVPPRQPQDDAAGPARERRAQPRRARDVVILSIETQRVPHIADSDRLVSDNLGDPDDRITCLTARFGFQDDTDVPATLRLADRLGLLEGRCDFDNATYFLSQITIVPGDAPGMSRWRKHLFLTMAHNAASPVEYPLLCFQHAARSRSGSAGEDL